MKSGKVFFSPPLWVQRRTKILAILQDHIQYIDSILDLGCGEGALLSVLPNDGLLASFIAGVDILTESLEECKIEVQPGELDRAYYLRERPCIFELYQGSLNTLDEQMKHANFDAIVMCEVIEHLFPEDLANLPHTLFQFYRPKLVIITTPNREYNRLFEMTSPFRNDDHKFEWDRLEFRNWSNFQAQKYGYKVMFTGVGDPPPGELTGFCTQIAVFTNPESVFTVVDKFPVTSSVFLSEKQKFKSSSQQTQHSLKKMYSIEFPWQEKENSPDQVLEQLEEELYYLMLNPITSSSKGEDVSRRDVHLKDLWKNLCVRQATRTPENLLFQLQKHKKSFLLTSEPVSIVDPFLTKEPATFNGSKKLEIDPEDNSYELHVISHPNLYTYMILECTKVRLIDFSQVRLKIECDMASRSLESCSQSETDM